MTEAQAIELLSYHSQSSEGINNPKWEKGFLGMLKHFTGSLYEENYNEMMAIIDTLAGVLKQKDISRGLISDLWAVCYFARLWGLDEDGMLIGNKMLTEEQINLLTKWVDAISERITFILRDIE